MNKFMRWNDPDDGACSGNIEVLSNREGDPMTWDRFITVRRVGQPEADTFEVLASELGEPREFYKTTVTFTVLSEEPIPLHSLVLDISADLRRGNFPERSQSGAVESHNGLHVGNFSAYNRESLNGGAMADALYESGSEPGFFGLDDSGQDV